MFRKSILKEIAKKEGVSLSHLENNFKKGRIVIPHNNKREIKKIIAIGKGLKVKVNTNLGTSTERREFKDELEKLAIAVKYGTDTIMDLSVGGNLRKIRKEIIKASPVPVGSVPIYEVASEVERLSLIHI